MRRHEGAWYQAIGIVVENLHVQYHGFINGDAEGLEKLEALSTILKGRERRMKQRAVQLGTFSNNVAEQINAILDKNPAWQFVSVTNIQVHRIGGPDIHVIVIFEAPEHAPSFVTN